MNDKPESDHDLLVRIDERTTILAAEVKKLREENKQQDRSIGKLWTAVVGGAGGGGIVSGLWHWLSGGPGQ